MCNRSPHWGDCIDSLLEFLSVRNTKSNITWPAISSACVKCKFNSKVKYCNKTEICKEYASRHENVSILAIDLHSRQYIIAKNMKDAWPGDTGITASVFF